MKKKYLLLIVFLCLYFPLTGCGNYVSFSDEITQTLTLNSETTFFLDTLNGSVVIEPTTGDGVILEMERIASGTDPVAVEDYLQNIEVKIVQSDETVSVQVVRKILPSGVNSIGVSFVVKLPVERFNNMNLNTSNGSITVRDFSGDLRVDSSNGRIELNNVNGTIVADTSNDRIIGNGITGDIQAYTSNGSIEIITDHILFDTVLKTSNGDIYVRTRLDNYNFANYSMETSNGNITLVVPPDSPMTVDAQVSNGSIRCFDQTYEDDIFGVDLFGGGVGVNLITSNGNIEIRGGTF